MQILVTGGLGFIGSQLCKALLDRGHYVFCVDNFYTGEKNNVTDDEAFNLAIEHLDYNVIGGSLGEFTPVVMYKDG